MVFAMATTPAWAQSSTAPEALEALVATYCQAWSEPDRSVRARLLDQVWADDGTYTDPTVEKVAGRSALIDHIGDFLQQNPGARIVPATATDSHHAKLHFGWKMVLPDGTVPLQGVDYGELATDGKISRIVGFFTAPAAGH
jgi:hypothetical protein